MAKKYLSLLLESPLGHQLLRAARRLDERRPNRCQVLTYHVVSNYASFEEQVGYLATHYNIVSLTDMLDAFSGRRTLPPRALMITFDDAYRSFAECAWPILRRHDLPVTMFVATAYPGAPENVYWWDRLEDALLSTARRDQLDSPAGRLPLATPAQRRAALKCLKKYLWKLPQTELLAWVHEISARLGVTTAQSKVMNWDELRRLKRQGLTLAPHSRTHPVMSHISREEAHREVAGSYADLERETGTVLPVFAYPGGHYIPETAEVLAEESFFLAFTTLRGVNDVSTTPPLELRRNHISRHATLRTLQARLLYGSSLMNKWHSMRKNARGIES